jgi:hypothetical protein
MARQAQLVSQHLENISHEALSKYATRTLFAAMFVVVKEYMPCIERMNSTTSDLQAIFGAD